MTKEYQLNEIQNRLPEGIYIIDETSFELTEDEFVSILCWIKYFNNHYENYGKTELPMITYPVISTRIVLDFGLYHIPSELKEEKGKNVIYLTGKKQKQSVNKIISKWSL